MILDDITREKALVEQEIELSQTGSFDRMMLNSLKQKLSNQVTRCKMLHEALAQQKGQFVKILQGKLPVYSECWGIVSKLFKYISDTRTQHQAQIIELEGLVASTKAVLRQQTVKFKDQVHKLVMSDTIIEQLIVDNDHLTSKLINMKQKVSEQEI